MRNISRFNKLLKSVKSYKKAYSSLSDEQLKKKTDEFRQRIQEGESTDALLPEAFAAVCEADYRVLGLYPYDTQILGAIALHKCCLAEMYTGEGKTLTASMPLYLNALTRKSTILVTANDYLALRDAKEIGPVYEFMGLTIRAGVARNPEIPLTSEQKRKNYNADILYTTHSALAFDYLLEHLVTSASDRFLRPFYYVIIDEADSVLLDGAQMPLVISGSPRVQSNLYPLADFFVSVLKENEDYEQKDKSVWLTDRGVKFAQQFFGIDRFYAKENFELNRQVTLALRAHVLFKRGREYMMSDTGQIILLDNATGRSMPGMKLRGGQQQALETKEKLEISQEQRSVASITFQNLFLMFPRMAGMSGTIYDARYELHNVYRKKVVRIPPHRPLKRKDMPDRFFLTAEEQFDAAVREVLRRHASGQPVLVVTNTIQDTEAISRMLVDDRIPHSVLNANNAYWEAEIIAVAGQKDAITISTGIAGRGTDIRLGEGVRELGGLAVIGVGRMQNVRLEKQARGRSGRQGDPGVSQFYVSLEDEVVDTLGEGKISRFLERKHPLRPWHIRYLINHAQRVLEEKSVSSRELSVRYDKVMKRQRDILYEARDRLLDRSEISRETIRGICRDTFQYFLEENRHLDSHIMNHFLLDNLSYELASSRVTLSGRRQEILRQLMKYSDDLYDDKLADFADHEQAQEYIRACVLHAVDDAWIEEVDYLQQLQYATLSRGMAQKNPVFEYSREAYRSFEEMKRSIRKNIVRNFYLGEPQTDVNGKLSIIFP